MFFVVQRASNKPKSKSPTRLQKKEIGWILTRSTKQFFYSYFSVFTEGTTFVYCNCLISRTLLKNNLHVKWGNFGPTSGKRYSGMRSRECNNRRETPTCKDFFLCFYFFFATLCQNSDIFYTMCLFKDMSRPP